MGSAYGCVTGLVLLAFVDLTKDMQDDDKSEENNKNSLVRPPGEKCNIKFGSFLKNAKEVHIICVFH